jgi:probable rRNA maturation factor
LCGDAVIDLARAVLHAENALGSLAIVCVDEAVIKELNLRYRGVDEATDILAFPEEDDQWPAEAELLSGLGKSAMANDLGELVLCPAVIVGYAHEDGIGVGRQLGWTVIHGMLHLLGYDHETDEGEMRSRERRLLDELGPMLANLDASEKV